MKRSVLALENADHAEKGLGCAQEGVGLKGLIVFPPHSKSK